MCILYATYLKAAITQIIIDSKPRRIDRTFRNYDI